MSNNKQRLKCIKCKKIICEAESLEKLKQILGEKDIICPHCGHQYLNPLY